MIFIDILYLVCSDLHQRRFFSLYLKFRNYFFSKKMFDLYFWIIFAEYCICFFVQFLFYILRWCGLAVGSGMGGGTTNSGGNVSGGGLKGG